MNLCKDCKHSLVKAKEPKGSSVRHRCVLFVEATDSVSGNHVYFPCGLARLEGRTDRCNTKNTKFEKVGGWHAFVKGIFW